MSDDEEEAGGFGDATDSEEDGGLGFGAADEDEDEEIDGDGFGDDFGGADESEEEDTGFGDAADEDEDEGADAPAPAKAAPVEKKPEPPKHSFDTFAKEHFTSASTTYEHPGLHKAITEPLTNIVGPIDKAMAMALWEKLLVFMGDKPEKTPTSAFKKIHDLCTEGLGREPLRKEIYCQLLKQLNKNSSRASAARGWILLNMYLGSFCPPEEMYDVIEAFIAKGPAAFKEFALTKLMRAIANGSREGSPLQVELKVVKSRQYLQLPITIAGTEVEAVAIDSLTTTKELLNNTTKKVGLNSSRGFAVRLKAGTTITSIGESDVKVLDLLGAAEAKHGEGVWKLELTKEYFAPWHPSIQEDPLALELSTQQIFAAVGAGKFKLKDEEAYIQFAAERYYVEFGEVDEDTMKDFLKTAIPKKKIAVSGKKGKGAGAKGAKSLSEWTALVEKAHAKSKIVQANTAVADVREAIITRFLSEWAHLFVTCFAVTKGPGPAIKGMEDGCSIALNPCGIFVLQGETKVLQKWGWHVIEGVKADVNGDFVVKTLADEVARTDSSQYSFKPVFKVDVAQLATVGTRMKTSDAAPVKL